MHQIAPIASIERPQQNETVFIDLPTKVRYTERCEFKPQAWAIALYLIAHQPAVTCLNERINLCVV